MHHDGSQYLPARLALLPAARLLCDSFDSAFGRLCSEPGQSCRMDAPAPAMLRAKLQVRYFELGAPALPRGLELLRDEAGIVVPLLRLERLLQSEQRTWVARVVV